MRPGNRVEGPAIVEAEYTTVVVPPGNVFSMDQHGFGVLKGEPLLVREAQKLVGAKPSVGH
jgi:N-methylhydantoinase A/acetophenone carboxylase